MNYQKIPNGIIRGISKKERFFSKNANYQAPKDNGPTKSILICEQTLVHGSWTKKAFRKGFCVQIFQKVLRTGHCTTLARFAQLPLTLLLNLSSELVAFILRSWAFRLLFAGP